MQKPSTIALLTLLLSIVGGSAFSQCSYVTKNKLGAESRVIIPCDFPVLMTTDDLAQDTVTYKSAAAQWNRSHPTLTFISVLPGPAASGNFIEIPASAFSSFPLDRQAALKRVPYYYRVKL